MSHRSKKCVALQQWAAVFGEPKMAVRNLETVTKSLTAYCLLLMINGSNNLLFILAKIAKRENSSVAAAFREPKLVVKKFPMAL